jgi:D-serine deaminase-like pyridoxal phosphate-dependent protein
MAWPAAEYGAGQISRRRFVAGGLAAGWCAASPLHDGLAPLFARDGSMPTAPTTKAEIPTPALVLDLDRFEANIAKLAEFGRQSGRGLRPHAKTHKCPEIARRQRAAGAIGISAATVAEAEGLAAAGIRGLLLTSPIVEPRKIARVVELAKHDPELMLAVGHAREAELLAAAAESAGVDVGVLVDVDVGDHRTGITPGEPALELAKLLGRCKRLKVRGVQAYAGSASHVVGFAAREKYSREVMARAVETRRLLASAGFDAAILSGGSTGTYNIDGALEGMTELQCGSYVFMDIDYRRIGGRDGATYADFQPSLKVLATVVSTTESDRSTIDAGTKAIDTTTGYMPVVEDRPEIVYKRAGDEFGILSVDKAAGSGAAPPRIGERMEFIVPHCDPTVCLHDRIYACRGEKVEGVWPIVARRETA